MSFQGADPERVREATARLRVLADKLEATTKDLNTKVVRSSDWTGADGDGFRAEWTAVSHKQLASTVAALRAGADTLWRNAADQEQVSSVSGGTSAPIECSPTNPEKAPSNASTMFSRLRNSGAPDGLYIEKVIGPDGETRFIVYFDGTGSADRLSEGRNVLAAGGMVDKAITDQIDAALRASGYKPGDNGPQMMFVGFSQGGMDAQNIAAHGRYNVTNLVTYGSPLTQADVDGVSTVHLRSDGDTVPRMLGGAADVAKTVLTSPAAPVLNLVTDLSGYGDRVPTTDPFSGASSNIYTYDAKTDGDLLFGNHGSPNTYENVGDSFEGDSSDRAVRARESMVKFEGYVAETWRPDVD